jgi:hypothetical protein
MSSESDAPQTGHHTFAPRDLDMQFLAESGRDAIVFAIGLADCGQQIRDHRWRQRRSFCPVRELGT